MEVAGLVLRVCWQRMCFQLCKSVGVCLRGRGGEGLYSINMGEYNGLEVGREIASTSVTSFSEGESILALLYFKYYVFHRPWFKSLLIELERTV